MFFPNNWKFEDILYLIYSKKYKTNEIIHIINNYDDLNSFFQNQIGLFPYTIKEFDKILNIRDTQLKSLEKYNAKIISFWDESYPSLLKEISYPPIFLIVTGILQKSDSLSISVVGTRKPSNYGRDNAQKFVKVFAENGIIITSGMAYGIDSIAHQTAIENNGITYAVIASGLDKVTNFTRDKINKIIDSNGAVITEFLFGISAKPGYFPQRNRIISGISKALLIIESALKGGSMITARFAFDQNREIFAIPNNINAEKSKGCNYLIYKNIAIAALTPEQILTDLNIKYKSNNKKQEIIIEDHQEKLIFDLLNHDPIHIDVIADKLNMNITDVLVKLLNLEFRGIIKQMPGKYFLKNI